jgi:hypothetical protein
MLQQYIRTIVSVQIVAVCFSNGFDSHSCKAVRSKNDLLPLFQQFVPKITSVFIASTICSESRLEMTSVPNVLTMSSRIDLCSLLFQQCVQEMACSHGSNNVSNNNLLSSGLPTSTVTHWTPVKWRDSVSTVMSLRVAKELWISEQRGLKNGSALQSYFHETAYLSSKVLKRKYCKYHPVNGKAS